MKARKTTVLVTDDSPLMRRMISDVLEQAGMDVVAKAADGRRAVEYASRLNPDVITLDVQMPGMDGLQTLDALLAKRPCRVLMVSGMTHLGANITLEALDRGALDYVAKPDAKGGATAEFKAEVIRKVKTIADADVERMLALRRDRAQRRQERRRMMARQGLVAPKPAPAPVAKSDAALADKVIALGISTGGPPALTRLFETLSAPTPPIAIVQHMPRNFTAAFAKRLNEISPLHIKEAESGDVLTPNHVYIAPGGRHMALRRQGNGARIVVFDGEPVSCHRPSVDVLLESAATIYGSRCLGVIMTGMGRDGANGCKAIREAGGFVLGQDEATSDVYGMNKVAFREGGVDKQFALSQAALTITKQTRSLWASSPAGR